MTSIKDLPLKLFEVREGNELIMRLGLGLTLFLPRPFEAAREGVWDLWRQFLDLAGKDRFQWARLGGGNRSRAVNPSVYRTIEAWLTGKKDYGKDCWISIHDGPMDCLGEYGFVLEGLGPGSEEDEDIGSLDLTFPVGLLDTLGGPGLAGRVVALAAKVAFLSGTAGFIFQRSPYKYNATVGKMAALSQRFEGVEVTASQKEQYWAGKGLVSVNWITFVGDGYVTRLGGREALAAALPAACTATPLDHGVAIRAGDLPLLGDRNTGKDELRLWRQVYKVLRPAQFVDSIYEFDPFAFDGTRTAEWLQRLKS
jgi:hypothetical protein